MSAGEEPLLHWAGDEQAVWDDTSAVWEEEGSETPVAWQDGAIAVFEEDDRSITIAGEKEVGGLLLEGHNVALQGDSLIPAGGPEFEIHTKDEATIDAPIEPPPANGDILFRKTGEGTLSLGTVLDWPGDIVFSGGTVSAAFPEVESMSVERTLTLDEDVRLHLTGPVETNRRWISATDSLTELQNDFDVSVAVLNNQNWLAKEGDGDLFIGELNGAHWLRIMEGDVFVDHANDGRPFMRWGQRLEITGYLTSLTMAGREESVLSIGGDQAGELMVKYLGIGNSFGTVPRVEFTLNKDAQDRITVLETAGGATFIGATFHFLGREGLELGTAYELIALPPDLAEEELGFVFSLSEEMKNDGWAATFFQDGAGIFVRFCAFPDTPPLTFSEAAGFAFLGWETSEQNPWVTRHCASDDGGHRLAATTGPGEAAWLEAEIEGPGVLSFDHLIDDSTTGEFSVSLNGDDLVHESHLFIGRYSHSVTIPDGVHNVRWTLAETDDVVTQHLENLRFAPRRFSAWSGAHGYDPSVTPESDPGNSGVPLVLRYALGLDPEAGRDELPVIEQTGDDGEGRVQFSFRRPRDVQDLDYIVETTDDFHDWETVPQVDWETVSRYGGWETVTVDGPAEPDTAAKHFMRVRVETVQP